MFVGICGKPQVPFYFFKIVKRRINNFTGFVNRMRRIATILLLIVVSWGIGPLTISAQSPDWNDTLRVIVSSERSDSSKVAELGAKIIYLTTNARKEAKDFLAAMEQLLQRSKDPRLLAELYYSKAIVWNFTIPREQAMAYIDSCIHNASRANSTQFLIRGFRLKGQFLERFNELGEAEQYLQKAYEYCGKTNNPFETYRTLLALSFLNEKQGKFTEFLERSLKALEIAEKNEITATLGSVYLRIAKGYLRTGDKEKALQYFEKTEQFASKNQQSILPEVYSNLGTCYQTFHDFDKALAFYIKSDSTMQAQNEYKESFSVYSNMATIYSMMNQLDSAERYFNKSIGIAEQSKYRFLGRTYINYATYLIKSGNGAKALIYADKAIVEITKNDDGEALSEAYQVKGEALSAMDSIGASINWFKEALTVKDSIHQIIQKESVAELLTKYDTQKKESEISRLNSEKRIQQLSLEKQAALLAGNALEATKKQQEIDLLNQQQQIQNLTLNYQKEALALKNLEVMANEKKLTIAEQETRIRQAEADRQRWTKNMILAAGIALFAFLALAFNQYRIGTHRKNETEKLNLKNQLSELRLEALRSQMNPHFIFNALNSVNRYIVRNSPETASEYLIKFSKLIRQILENSKSPTITLENELDALRLYIEIELLRFDHKFDYKISVDDSINKEKVKIPPMIFQPFVENAIWHGLMNKNNKGNISIDVKYVGEKRLFVAIEDNGVGRKNAGMNKSQSGSGHKSMGLSITEDVLKTINGNDGGVRIIDLFDEQNNPSGTRVEMEINTQAA